MRENLILDKLPVHTKCNLSFQQDEEYFVYSLMPFGRGSYSGDALRNKILQDCGNHQQQRALLGRVLSEFEKTPSGLMLPPGRIAKRFDTARILRVAWKVVRGLYFADTGVCLPEDAPRKLDIILPGETPPDSFFALAGKEDRGRYPGVFAFTPAAYPDFHGFNYWAILLWDRIILTVGFQWPTCQCAECLGRFG